MKSFSSSTYGGCAQALRRLVSGLWLLLLFSVTAKGQEAWRASLASQDMAEARQRALENQRFNAKLGPVSLRFSAAVSAEGTDNVRATESDTQADFSIRSQLNTFALWRVTERNSLTFGTGIGFRKYVNTTDYDSLYITPDTDVSFDIYAGDFLINLHDNFDYSQDVTSDPTVSGTGSLGRFENTIGTRVTWDLNKAVISFQYDHRDYIATESKYDYLTHTAELLSTSAGFQINPTLQTGLTLSGGLLDYDQNLVQDNQHLAIGPFLNGQISEYTSFQLGVGYVMYFLDAQVIEGVVTNDSSTLDAFYVSAMMRQRVGNLLAHTISINRSVQSGIASQLLDLWAVQYAANWNIFRKTGFSTSLSYEHGVQKGLGGETLDRYGAGIAFSRTIAKRANLRLGYQFYYKDSDMPGRGYTQNRLVLDFNYTF